MRQQLAKRGPELGLLDAQVSVQLNRPELRLEVDRQRAADLNADVQSIASAMRLMVGGDERVSRFHDAEVNEDYDVQLRLAEGFRNDPDTISRLYVPTKDGKLVRLDNVVKLHADAERLADQSTRPPAPGDAAGLRRSRIRTGGPQSGADRGRPRAEHAGGLLHARLPGADANWSERSRNSSSRSHCQSRSCT